MVTRARSPAVPALFSVPVGNMSHDLVTTTLTTPHGYVVIDPAKLNGVAVPAGQRGPT